MNGLWGCDQIVLIKAGGFYWKIYCKKKKAKSFTSLEGNRVVLISISVLLGQPSI